MFVWSPFSENLLLADDETGHTEEENDNDNDNDIFFQLMTRQDTLKEKNSGASCDKVRTITKNCKDKVEKDGGMSTCPQLGADDHQVLYYSTHSIQLIIEAFHSLLCRRNS